MTPAQFHQILTMEDISVILLLSSFFEFFRFGHDFSPFNLCLDPAWFYFLFQFVCNSFESIRSPFESVYIISA